MVSRGGGRVKGGFFGSDLHVYVMNGNDQKEEKLIIQEGEETIVRTISFSR